jgi:hypothetical protein
MFWSTLYFRRKNQKLRMTVEKFPFTAVTWDFLRLTRIVLRCSLVSQGKLVISIGFCEQHASLNSLSTAGSRLGLAHLEVTPRSHCAPASDELILSIQSRTHESVSQSVSRRKVGGCSRQGSRLMHAGPVVPVLLVLTSSLRPPFKLLCNMRLSKKRRRAHD